MSHSRAALILIAAGTLSSLATPAQEGEVDSRIQVVKEGHAARLVTVFEHAIRARFLSDADRLFREAKLWAPRLEGLERLATTLRNALVTSARGAEADEYRKFWSSSGYEGARRELLQQEERARESTLEDLEALAKELVAGQDVKNLDEVIRFALELGLESGTWERTVGESRLARLEKERARELHIERLELGDTIIGPQVDIERLRGKVVLWRSFSL